MSVMGRLRTLASRPEPDIPALARKRTFRTLVTGWRRTWLPCNDGYGDRMIKIAPDYLDSTFHDATYDGLAWLSSSICAAEIFDINDAGYGLPQPLFVVVEGLSWFAQSVRSGVTTYFEATPFERQRMMLHALEKEGAPDEMTAKYRSGMTGWKEPASAADLG